MVKKWRVKMGCAKLHIMIDAGDTTAFRDLKDAPDIIAPVPETPLDGEIKEVRMIRTFAKTP